MGPPTIPAKDHEDHADHVAADGQQFHVISIRVMWAVDTRTVVSSMSSWMNAGTTPSIMVVRRSAASLTARFSMDSTLPSSR